MSPTGLHPMMTSGMVLGELFHCLHTVSLRTMSTVIRTATLPCTLLAHKQRCCQKLVVAENGYGASTIHGDEAPSPRPPTSPNIPTIRLYMLRTTSEQHRRRPWCSPWYAPDKQKATCASNCSNPSKPSRTACRHRSKTRLILAPRPKSAGCHGTTNSATSATYDPGQSRTWLLITIERSPPALACLEDAGIQEKLGQSSHLYPTVKL